MKAGKSLWIWQLESLRFPLKSYFPGMIQDIKDKGEVERKSEYKIHFQVVKEMEELE